MLYDLPVILRVLRITIVITLSSKITCPIRNRGDFCQFFARGKNPYI
jgi:hypothetical protein